MGRWLVGNAFNSASGGLLPSSFGQRFNFASYTKAPMRDKLLGTKRHFFEGARFCAKQEQAFEQFTV